MAASKHSFATLDGLRGVAAIAIVTGHTGAFGDRPLFESYLAVDFFFVLSGFVLMHAYSQKLQEGMPPLRFMLIRLIRLYPLYLLALVLALLSYAWAALHSSLYGVSLRDVVTDAAFAILMLPSPVSHHELFPLNYPTWSLFFELLANAVLALNGRHLTTKRLSLIVAGSGLLLCCAVATQWFGLGTDAGAMLAGWYWSSFIAGLLRVSFSFFAGALTYRVWQKHPNQVHMPVVLIAATLIAVFAAHPPAFLGRAYDLTVTIIIFPALVFVGASSKPGRYWARVCLGLGLASYGVYVLQVPILGILEKSLSRLTNPPSLTPWSGVASIAFLFLFALATDYLFDFPVRRWLSILVEKRMFPRSRKSQSAVPPPTALPV